jgi:hypothetical protein
VLVTVRKLPGSVQLVVPSSPTPTRAAAPLAAVASTVALSHRLKLGSTHVNDQLHCTYGNRMPSGEWNTADNCCFGFRYVEQHSSGS